MRDGYEFDPDSYDEAGGLLGRLRALIQQQGQPFAPAASANSVPPANPTGPDSQPGGLLGRLMALQAAQSGYQPSQGNWPAAPAPNNPASPPAPRDPNFRQLTRRNPPPGVSQGTIGPANLPSDLAPQYSPYGQGAVLDLLHTSQMQQDQYQPQRSPDGVDYDALTRLITGAESNGRPTVKADKSSATGAGQFIEKTWVAMIKQYRPDIYEQYVQQYGSDPKTLREALAPLRTNPVLSADMTKAYAMENAAILRSSGFPVTPANISLAHFLGPNESRTILRTDPSVPAESVLREDTLNANPFLRKLTAGGVQAWAARRIEDQATASAKRSKDAAREAFSRPQPAVPFYPQPTPDND